MTDAQAAAKAKKRWGNKYYVCNSGFMSSDAKRDKARGVVQAARAEITRIDTEINRRLSELDWLQELRKEKRKQTEVIRKTEGEAHHRRFQVGKSNRLFTEIVGSGDTWEEAFAEADQRESR